MSQLISSLAVGAKVKYGTYQVEASTTLPIIWQVIDQNHTGYPNNSVTLLTDKIIDLRGLDAKEPSNADASRVSYGNNRYRTSNLRQWLNSSGIANYWWTAQNPADGKLNTNNADTTPNDTGMSKTTGYSDIQGFLKNFTAQELGRILDTTLTVARNTSTDGGASETVLDKVFLLSNTEVGLANENSIVEGSLFSLGSSLRTATLTAQSFDNTLAGFSKPATVTTAYYWWLRTPTSFSTTSNRVCSPTGTLGSSNANTGNYGVRPAMNLANDILVSDAVDVDGCYVVEYPTITYHSQPITNLAVGSKIKFGTYCVESSSTQPIIWKVIDKNHSGYPTGSITLLTEKIIDLRGFDAKEPGNADASRVSGGNNRYSTSNIRQWLNSSSLANAWWTAQNLTDGTANTNNADTPPNDAGMGYLTGYDNINGFLNNFTTEELARMSDTNLTVARNTVTDGGGSESVVDKVFLLSMTEVGLANENSIVEGSLFPIFTSDADRLAYLTDQGFQTLSTSKPATTTTSWQWMLRTPKATVSNSARVVGGLTYNSAYAGNSGVRPAVNLTTDTLVSDVVDADGCYIIMQPSQPVITYPIDINSDVSRNIAVSGDLALDLIRQVKASTIAVLDTSRKTTAVIGLDSDLVRHIGASATTTLDTKRTIAVTADLNSSTNRNVSVLSELTPDTKRAVNATLDIGIDTQRQVSSGVQLVITATKRKLVSSISSVADTKRKIATSFSFASDVKRSVVRSVSSIIDLKRRVTASVSSMTDSKRKVTISASLIATTKRKVAVSASFAMGLKRKVVASIFLAVDAKRRLTTLASLITDTKRKLILPVSFVSDTLRKVISYRPHRIKDYAISEITDRYAICEIMDKYIVEEDD
ncbi:DUF6273 domain-containing protein [Desulfosporosinus metallidurans]|uniref:IgA protease n=1 Tax=Desulfosporosinus metallidurans TaxID=1888891 RepID=A0A1Q8QJL8_9FIRM|nr:DUF6273 domain-containing protein [Desulfosporosinus metallidurans]OLN27516.1 IgA protease [Desulfosporosinus metallidurans]